MLQLTPREGANVEPWPTSANLITPTHSTVWASHNGCRPDTIAMRLQLTPREGANRSRRGTDICHQDFNSRPRVGANLCGKVHPGSYPGFNSRPCVGANRFLLPEPPGPTFFNSRPRVGGELNCSLLTSIDGLLQLTPP